MNDLNDLINLLIKEKGGTKADYRELMDSIAYHESAHTMDPSTKQKGGGPGRGKYQLEEGDHKGGITAVNRLHRYLKDNDKTIPKWLTAAYKGKSLDASTLTDEQQDMLFLGFHKGHPKSDFSKVWKKEQTTEDFWLNNHWAGDKIHRKARGKSFRNSMVDREKRAINQASNKKVVNSVEKYEPTVNSVDKYENQAAANLTDFNYLANAKSVYNSNKKAMGGEIQPTNQNNLNSFNVGGLHSQNPYGGIPQGMGQNGKPNTVEQGETSFKIKGNKYIFSNRIGTDGSMGAGFGNNQFGNGGEPAPAIKKKDNTNIPKKEFIPIKTKEQLQEEESQRMQQQQGSIREDEGQSWYGKAWDVITNPMTAAESYMNRGYVPDNMGKAIKKGQMPRNIMEIPSDVINVPGYADYVAGLPSAISQGNYGDAALRGASIIPGVKGVVSVARKSSKAANNYSRGLLYKIEKGNLRDHQGIMGGLGYNDRQKLIAPYKLDGLEELYLGLPNINKKISKNIKRKVDKILPGHLKNKDNIEKLTKKIIYNRESEIRFIDLYKQKLVGGKISREQFNFVDSNPSYASFLKDNGKLDDALNNINKYLTDDKLINEFQEVWSKSQRGVTLPKTASQKDIDNALKIGGRGQWDYAIGKANYSSNSNTILDRFSTPYGEGISGYKAQLKLTLPGLNKATTGKEKLAIINKYTANDISKNFNNKLKDPNTMVIESSYGSGSAERVVSKKALTKNPDMLKITSAEKRVREGFDADVHSKMGAYGLKDSKSTMKHFPYSRDLLRNLSLKQQKDFDKALKNLPYDKKQKFIKITKKREKELLSLETERTRLRGINTGEDRLKKLINVERRIKNIKKESKAAFLTIGGVTSAISSSILGVKYIHNSTKETRKEIEYERFLFKESLGGEKMYGKMLTERRGEINKVMDSIGKKKWKELPRKERSAIVGEISRKLETKYIDNYNSTKDN